MHNILVGDKWVEEDKELFFGPLSTEEFIIITEPMKMAHLLYKLNLFTSVGQAKKAGWDKEIPAGYSEFVIGKLKKELFILNITEL